MREILATSRLQLGVESPPTIGATIDEELCASLSKSNDCLRWVSEISVVYIFTISYHREIRKYGNSTDRSNLIDRILARYN